MNKTPIKPGEIKAGDKIRWEGDDEAQEWRAETDGDAYEFSKGQHYRLLDAVVVPREAYEALVAEHEKAEKCDWDTAGIVRRYAISDFLDAVDKANGGTP